MKNKRFIIIIFSIISMVLAGCSFSTSYIVRNFSAHEVIFSFKPFGGKDPQIKIAYEVIKLRSSGLKKLEKRAELIKKDSLYSFIVPPESSADISFLFDRHYNLLSDEAEVYKLNKRIAVLQNTVGASAVFKEKYPGLFGSGGIIYYYDIQ